MVTKVDTLFRISKNNSYELGDYFVYVNSEGDTIIPYKKYVTSYTDTITTFGIVGTNRKLIGINQQGEELYEVYFYDNGPDYVSEGLFRIIQNGKIGYADKKGKIVIQPQFKCASPFNNGKAKVTFKCTKEKDVYGHTRTKNNTWFFINSKGEKIQ